MPKNNETFKAFGFDKALFVVTLMLVILGILMVFSSSAVLASERYQQPFYFLINQIVGAVMGLVFIFLMVSIRRPLYQSPFVILGLLGLTLVLLTLCLNMPSYANTNRWVEFFGIRFQPSELAKISLVLFLAFYLERKREKLHEWHTLIIPLAVVFLFVILILKEPDYGTAILVFSVCAILLFIGRVRLRHLAILGAGALCIFMVYLFQASYRLERIMAILFPERDPLGKSFQVIQSKLAVGSGGLLGVSIGESTQKLFFLPCAHTDFIYAILGEELGLVGTLTTLLLFLILLWRGIVISSRAPNLFCQLSAAGLTLFIFFQALLNITIVLGLGPPTGIPLPLISFGRSSLITTLIAVGILLHISQRKIYSGIKG